ncbi:hypothetical protein RZS08_04435, partial [Arthrospira platensis SPKY1]|nr:hypothetical protein [Arthrospira platensis SPKY1]
RSGGEGTHRGPVFSHLLDIAGVGDEAQRLAPQLVPGAGQKGLMQTLAPVDHGQHRVQFLQGDLLALHEGLHLLNAGERQVRRQGGGKNPVTGFEQGLGEAG